MPAPNRTSPSSISSRSMCSVSSFPRGLVLEKNTLISDTKMCRCFEYGM